jgi:hypothetical protein
MPDGRLRRAADSHMDLWILPFASAFAKVPLSQPWLLMGGVMAGHGCMTEEAMNASSEGWWCGAKTAGLAAMRVVRHQGLLPASWPQIKLCVGWSDLFFVPLSLAAKYAELAEIFWKHHVANEISTHTIIAIVSQMGHHGAPYFVRCAGGPLGSVTASSIGQAHCGHRIDLRDPAQASALGASLKRFSTCRTGLTREKCDALLAP